MDYPDSDIYGGWPSSNDVARVIIIICGSLVMMVCDVLVNDPANFPQRFTTSYKEAVTYVYTLQNSYFGVFVSFLLLFLYPRHTAWLLFRHGGPRMCDVRRYRYSSSVGTGWGMRELRSGQLYCNLFL